MMVFLHTENKDIKTVFQYKIYKAKNMITVTPKTVLTAAITVNRVSAHCEEYCNPSAL